MRFYILDDQGIPQPTDDMHKFGEMFEDSKIRRVDYTEIGDIRISTVFLGIDHNYTEQGPPILFETMIFGGEHDQYQERYCTKEEAVTGHTTAVEMVKRTTHKEIES